ncbi:MAG TPA: RNA 2',3'-cyclic phosphodiesterase [Bacillota bacterium]
MARLFIGVWLSAALREEVAQYLEIARQGSTGLKWTLPEQLHFTLKFLGDINEADIPRLTESLQELAAGIPSFTVTLGAPGYFPKAENLRIVWLGLREGGPALKRLANSVEALCVAAGFAPADHPFRPHLTLARIRRDQPVRISLPGAVFTNCLKVQAFWLIESRLTPTGPVYRSIAEFPLKNLEFKNSQG